MPSACLSFAKSPITKLPKIKRTLPFVNECLIIPLFLKDYDSSLLKTEIKTKLIIIGGDSIKAIIATICPCNEIC